MQPRTFVLCLGVCACACRLLALFQSLPHLGLWHKTHPTCKLFPQNSEPSYLYMDGCAKSWLICHASCGHGRTCLCLSMLLLSSELILHRANNANGVKRAAAPFRVPIARLSIEIWEWRNDTPNAIGCNQFGVPISKLNWSSSSRGLFWHVPLKRDRLDWVWDWRMNDTPNTIVCTSTHHSNTAYRTQDDIFECCFKAQSSKLEGLFCHVSVERNVRALSFELWKSFWKCHRRWDWLYIQTIHTSIWEADEEVESKSLYTMRAALGSRCGNHRWAPWWGHCCRACCPPLASAAASDAWGLDTQHGTVAAATANSIKGADGPVMAFLQQSL